MNMDVSLYLERMSILDKARKTNLRVFLPTTVFRWWVSLISLLYPILSLIGIIVLVGGRTTHFMNERVSGICLIHEV